MADLKISQLTGASTPLAGTEVLPIVQSGSTVKVSVANLTAGRAVATAGGSFTDNITQSTATKGVNFTANTPAAGMTSQLLNWYEEGTWTPTVATGIDLPTYATQTGRYTRIGRIVHVQCYLSVNGGTRNGGQLTVGGLPFTMGTFAGAGASISLVSGGLAAGAATNALPTIEFTGTSAYFYKTTGADFLGTDLSSATFRADFSGAYNV